MDQSITILITPIEFATISAALNVAQLDETMIVVIDKLVTEALEKAQARQQGASL